VAGASRRNRSGGSHWPEKVVPIPTETDILSKDRMPDGYANRAEDAGDLGGKTSLR
jgi:hypothetical protein